MSVAATLHEILNRLRVAAVGRQWWFPFLCVVWIGLVTGVVFSIAHLAVPTEGYIQPFFYGLLILFGLKLTGWAFEILQEAIVTRLIRWLVLPARGRGSEASADLLVRIGRDYSLAKAKESASLGNNRVNRIQEIWEAEGRRGE